MTTSKEDGPAPASLSSPSGGPAVDSQGTPVYDPSRNVLDLVDAAVKRINDLADIRTSTDRALLELHVRRLDDLRCMEAGHLQTVIGQRADYERLLLDKEAKRLNDIRAVDVNAVAEASRVATASATTLASQVATSAETLRTQVATVATATSLALSNALEPLQKAIEDLRRVQYETAGQRTAKTENTSSTQWMIGLGIGVMVLIINVGLAVVLHFLPSK